MSKNVFRILILLALGFNFYNAFLGDIVPRFSLNAWGKFKAGPFLTVLFVWLILEIVNRLSHSRGTILPGSLWGLATFGLLLDSSSDYAHLYDRFSRYDSFMHFLAGGVLVGFLMIKAIEHFSVKSPISPLVKYGLAILLVNFIGLLYEIFEFLADRFFGAGNITGRLDTTEDLILNALGALTIILIHYFFFKKEFKSTDVSSA